MKEWGEQKREMVIRTSHQDNANNTGKAVVTRGKVSGEKSGDKGELGRKGRDAGEWGEMHEGVGTTEERYGEIIPSGERKKYWESCSGQWEGKWGETS